MLLKVEILYEFNMKLENLKNRIKTEFKLYVPIFSHSNYQLFAEAKCEFHFAELNFQCGMWKKSLLCFTLMPGHWERLH